MEIGSGGNAGDGESTRDAAVGHELESQHPFAQNPLLVARFLFSVFVKPRSCDDGSITGYKYQSEAQ